jgi:hypothetical protein
VFTPLHSAFRAVEAPVSTAQWSVCVATLCVAQEHIQRCRVQCSRYVQLGGIMIVCQCTRGTGGCQCDGACGAAVHGAHMICCQTRGCSRHHAPRTIFAHRVSCLWFHITTVHTRASATPLACPCPPCHTIKQGRMAWTPASFVVQ